MQMGQSVAGVGEHRLWLGQGLRLRLHVFFVNLVGMVRFGIGDDRPASAWPGDLN